jgi:hypothetical protein
VPTDFRAVPDWLSWENQDTGIAVTDLDGDGRPDLIVLRVDAPVGKNEGYYRVGRSLGDAGEVTDGCPVSSWSTTSRAITRASGQTATPLHYAGGPRSRPRAGALP